MARRWRDPAAFRADPIGPTSLRPSHRQSIALILVLILVVGTVGAVSYLVRPDDARSFDLFHGSLFLADAVAPVAVDLGSGRPTVRLVDAPSLVGAKRANDLGVVPVEDGTLLFNQRTGEFNMVDATGFVIKTKGGVPLQARPGSTRVIGVAARNFGYLAQTGPNGAAVYLVGQTTVQSAAAQVGTPPRPRASITMNQPIGTTPGSSASVGNDLWLLVGTGAERTVRRLSLPVDSNPGVALSQQDFGKISMPSALAGTESVGADGTAAVASDSRMELFRGSKNVSTVRYTAPEGVDSILPASNNSDRLSFLMHGTAGWSLVSVRSDGTGLRGPTALDIPAAATLIAPATSGGDLYTLDTRNGQILRIDGFGKVGRLTGLASYPLARQNGKVIESVGFGDAYAVGRGARVVLNSPNHLMAVVVFTDNTHAPLSIEKSSAVTVSAAGGAAAFGRGSETETQKNGQTVKAPAKGKPPTSPVNNKIDCAATSQKPHIPELGQPVPGSRSVLVQWSYPVNDQSDCVPTTYVVSVQTLSADAPTAQSSVTVQGQQSVNLSGLFPSTRYELAVTAYINGRGTTSAAIQVTTGPEGPAAPRSVTVTVDQSGTWKINWQSCGTERSGCIPSASWQVLPQFCDSRGLSGAPDAIDVAADPTAVDQPGATLTGGIPLLGRGLRFQVVGVGDEGNIGRPSASSPCVYSWSPPDASGVRIGASIPPGGVPVGGSVPATVSINLGADATRAMGGVGGQINLQLIGGGSTLTKTLTYDGRNSNFSTTFDNGVRAGARYTARAIISAPKHPDQRAVITSSDVTGKNPWPDFGVSADCPAADVLTCTLRVKLSGISSAQVNGERFSLSDSSQLRCGQVARPIQMTDFDPAATTIVVPNISQLNKFFGTCQVTIALVESPPAGSSDPLYFSQTESPLNTINVALGAAARAGAGPGDFTAAWSTRNGSSAAVKYTGNADMSRLTQGWTETILAPGGTTVCGTANDQPGTSDSSAVYVAASAQCVAAFGDLANGWTVSIDYHDVTDNAEHRFTIDLPGAPPGYQPCNPGGVAASWGPLKANGVSVRFLDGDLGGCSNWSFVLTSATGVSCGSATTPPPATIVLTCAEQPSAGWTVHITWTTPNGGSSQINPDTTVIGVPPSS